MIHVAPLDTEHIADSAVITETETYLEEFGYKTNTDGYYTVVNHKTDDSNSGYLVKKVTTTSKPFEQADIVEDEITILICSCAAYRFRDGIKDLEETNGLEWTPCKHCESVDKSIKAESDEAQSTL